MELSQGHSHGRSVAIGLRFALAFSYELGVLSKREWTSLHLSPLFRWLDSLTFSPLSEKKFREILEQDKKKVSATALQFVLLKKPGKPILKQIEIADLIAAGRKYGFITTTRRR
jgi:3-dehydroquinate synthetase